MTVSRRKLLTHSCGLGLASATIGSSLMSLGFARQAAASQGFGDYKALVCILLAGGNDSYNMLVPYELEEYDEYAGIRSDLALERDSLIVVGEDSSGREFGLHPSMPEVDNLYQAGELAFINNVGTLLEPVDAAGIRNGTAKVPVGLYSHSDQIAQWQTAVSYSRSAKDGWIGRVADLQGPNLANGISMNISLSGSNVLQSGQHAVPYSINREGDGARGIYAYSEGSFRQRMIDSVFSVKHANLLKREYSRRMTRALENREVFVNALRSTPELRTEFEDHYFARALRQIARVIGARSYLEAERQTFFVMVGGWDHHDEVLNNQARMLPWISNGLSQFRDALVEMGAFNDVLTFTISDFGRTLTSNGKGSDHGWGGHQMIMGGAVRGGAMYGEYPLLSPSSPLDTGRGRYIPTTATEEYFAELALWFGVERGALDDVLPNVREFYSPESSEPPMGFLNS